MHQTVRQAAWSGHEFEPNIDEKTGRLINDMPTCPRCGKLTRPDILMFGEWAWVDKYSELQMDRLTGRLHGPQRLVVMEQSASKALPTVWRFSE